MSKEAMKLALEAFSVIAIADNLDWIRHQAEQQANSLREALAEPPAQRKQVGDSRFESWFSEDFEPKAKGTKQQMREAYEAGMNDPSTQPAQQEPAWRTDGGIPRFKPAQRTWVGLTQEEFIDFASTFDYGTCGIIRAIEAKLKEKNT